MTPSSIAIIGGGIVGLATAYKASLRYPQANITLLEKEAKLAQHQSGHNSGVLHAGLYYKPGSLKARLAVSGIREMTAFCQEHSIAHDICGKLVVAVSEEEKPRLEELYARGEANGLQGLKRLGPEAMREIEPHVAGVAAVRVPEEGIVDYTGVCRALANLIESGGGTVRTSSGVGAIRKIGAKWAIEAGAKEFRADLLINCAGLHCDRIMEMAGESRTTRIVPFRGEYYVLKGEGAHLVRNLIYPVPDPKFPFLGVHFTRLIHGGVECGPNAVLALAREGYRWGNVDFRDLWDTLSYGGFWRFFSKYPSMAWYETRRSLSKHVFCQSLRRLVPAVELEHLHPGGAGVRAQALAPDGTLLQDFEFVLRPNALHLINAPSPGATASLAIASYLLDQWEAQTAAA